MSRLRLRRVSTRNLNSDPPPNRWRFLVNWLFASLMLGMPVVSTARVNSLKSPSSIWRRVVLVAFLVGLMATGRVALADLNNGLVAYYPFDGNANDESGNGNDGTVNGATLTEDRFGNAESAYNFDGNNANIQSLISINLAQGMSYSAWVLVQSRENSHANLISINGRSFSFFQWSNGIELCLSGCLGHHSISAFQENQWQHFVVTLNDEGVAQVFLNSELIKTLNPSSFPNLNNVPLYLVSIRKLKNISSLYE